MKTLLLALLLVTSSAWAEWVKVSSGQYIDPDSIRKDGDLRRVWELRNYEPERRSARARMEYDCKQERKRILSISTHSEPMAGGMIVSQYGEDSIWRDIPPDTVAELLLKIVCAK